MSGGSYDLRCATCGHTKLAHDGPGGVADCGECGCRDYTPPPSEVTGEHTPGPWTANLESDGGGYTIWGPESDDAFLANVGTAPTENRIVAFDVSEANARLIARAPDLLGEIAALRTRCDELHDQRHAEARKADALRAALAAAEGSEALWHRIADERSAEIERLSGELVRAREGRDKIEAEVEVELERATFQKFRDESYAREAKAGLIRTEIESRADKAEAEVMELRRYRTEQDCRYTLGTVADFGGQHCPLGQPCERCRRDAALAAAEGSEALWHRIADERSAEIERLHRGFDAMGQDGSAWAGMCDELDAEKARADAAHAEVERLRRIVEEVAASGVVLDDERLDYLEVQISRETWNEMKAQARAKETP